MRTFRNVTPWPRSLRGDCRFSFVPRSDVECGSHAAAGGERRPWLQRADWPSQSAAPPHARAQAWLAYSTCRESRTEKIDSPRGKGGAFGFAPLSASKRGGGRGSSEQSTKR